MGFKLGWGFFEFLSLRLPPGNRWTSRCKFCVSKLKKTDDIINGPCFGINWQLS